MDLDLTADQEFLAETTDRFLNAECPLTAVRALARSDLGFDRDTWRAGAELGWTSMLVPDEYGGGTVSGNGLRDLSLIAELFGRHVAPGPLVPTNVVASAIARSGSKQQRATALPAIVSGETVAAWCPPAGPSDPGAVVIETSGDSFVLSGTVRRVEAAAQAELLLVSGTQPEGVTQFLIAADTKGVQRQPLDGLDLVRRFADVHFDGAMLPRSAVVGAVGAASDDVAQQEQIAIVLHCAETVGAAARVFDFTLEWVFDRYSFGRPLASYQEIKHRFADMRMWLEASAATTAGAVRSVSSGSDDAAELVSVAKAYTGEYSTELCQDCVQMHGGIGVTWEHDIHLFLRRVTTNRGLYGTPAIHRERVATRLDTMTRAATTAA